MSVRSLVVMDSVQEVRDLPHSIRTKVAVFVPSAQKLYVYNGSSLEDDDGVVWLKPTNADCLCCNGRGRWYGTALVSGGALGLPIAESDVTGLVADLASMFKKDGSRLATGDFDLNTHQLNRVADGTLATDGVNKGQMDAGDAAAEAAAETYADGIVATEATARAAADASEAATRAAADTAEAAARAAADAVLQGEITSLTDEIARAETEAIELARAHAAAVASDAYDRAVAASDEIEARARADAAAKDGALEYRAQTFARDRETEAVALARSDAAARAAFAELRAIQRADDLAQLAMNRAVGIALSNDEWIKKQAEDYADTLFAGGTGSSIREPKIAVSRLTTGPVANQAFGVVAGCNVTFTLDEAQTVEILVFGTVKDTNIAQAIASDIGYKIDSGTAVKLNYDEETASTSAYSVMNGGDAVNMAAGAHTVYFCWGDGNSGATLLAGTDYPAILIVKYTKIKIVEGGSGALSDSNPADVSETAASPGVATEASRSDHVHYDPPNHAQKILASQIFGG